MSEYGIQQRLPDEGSVFWMGLISIIMVFCCNIIGIILGILAMTKGNASIALFESRPGEFAPDSLSKVKNGRMMGILGLVLSVLSVVVGGIYWATMGPEMMEMFREAQEMQN